MYVTKTLENKNLIIYFVEGIRYLEAKAYYNQKRGTYHWKRVYASDSKASPKKKKYLKTVVTIKLLLL